MQDDCVVAKSPKLSPSASAYHKTGVQVASGAIEIPRIEVFVAAVKSNVGTPANAPLYPEASVKVTIWPPPVAPEPPLIVQYNVTVVPLTEPVIPR